VRGRADDGQFAETPRASQANDTEPLPELQDEVVDDETVRGLFADLSELTRVLEIKLKGGLTEHSESGSLDLSSAESQLLGGSVHGVQILYEFEDELWCDTLMRVDGGTRLVRMQSPVRVTGHS
jgi:hypothetical protein